MVKIYTDGSYKPSVNPNVAGWAFVVNGFAQSGIVLDPVSRNIDGEIEAAKKAIAFAIENYNEDVEIYHDYQGIGAWADYKWKRNKELTRDYADFVQKAREKYEHKISFVWVRGHNGDEMNEVADEHAGNAVLLSRYKLKK